MVGDNAQDGRGRLTRWFTAAGGTLAIAAVALVVWTTRCPCDGFPGFILLGEVQREPVTDWRFVNDVPLCQIQIVAYGFPHAVNLNCMSTEDGKLFLSCGACSNKFWAAHVKPNGRGRLRLNGRVYPVIVNRALDVQVLDRVWATRVSKLQMYGGGPNNPIPPPDAKRPPTWWTFELQSAGD